MNRKISSIWTDDQIKELFSLHELALMYRHCKSGGSESDILDQLEEIDAVAIEVRKLKNARNIVSKFCKKYDGLKSVDSRRRLFQALSSLHGEKKLNKVLLHFMTLLHISGFVSFECIHQLSMRLQSMKNDREKLEILASHLTELPFGIIRKPSQNFSQIRARLDKHLYGLDDAKQRVIEQIALSLHSDGQFRSRPLLLVGDPGCGKTALGQAVASALRLPFFKISFSSCYDKSIFKGFAPYWNGATPGQFVRELITAGCENPVILYDEIDKNVIVGNKSGEMVMSLVELLDPGQSNQFRDSFLEIDMNLSRAFHICTANDLSLVPSYIRDRCAIISVPNYTEAERLVIVDEYLPRQIVRENRFRYDIRLTPKVSRRLAQISSL